MIHKQARIHRRLLLAPVLAAALVAAVFATSVTAAPQKFTGSITIALVAPFSGPFATSSQGTQRNLGIAIADMNKKGGVNGKKIHLVIKDDQAQPNLAVQYVREFMNQGIRIFYLQTTADALAVRPLMADGQAILFMGNPPDIQNDPKEFPYGFNFIASNKKGVTAIVSRAKTKGYKKWAIVSDSTGQFQTYVDNLKGMVPSGVQVVLEQNYDPTTTDFSSIVTKIRQADADAIFFFAAGAPVQGMLTAVQAAGLKTPILGGYGLVAADLSSFPRSLLQQVVCPVMAPTVLNAGGKPVAPGYTAVAERFWKLFGRKPLIAPGVGWDTANIIMWSIKKAGGDDPKKMRKALESTAKSGGLVVSDKSVKWSFSPQDHGGFPANGIHLANLVGDPNYPGYFIEATS